MRFIVKIFTRLAVLISAVMIIYIFSFFTLLALVPWDTAIARPEIGTWQRTINDFFEGRFGENLVILFFCLTTAFPVIKTLRQARKILLRGFVTNVLCLILVVTTFILCSNLIYIIFPYGTDYTNPFFHNYTRSIIPLTIYGIVYCWWFYRMMKLHKPDYKQKNKAKNSLTKPTVSRLIDNNTEDDLVNHQDNHVQSEYFTAQ